jgi:hypothetical protein
VASSEEVGFCLVMCALVKMGVVNPNVDDIPISKCDNKIVHCAPPGKDHDSRWLYSKTLTTTILQMRDVHNPRYGRVYSIKSHGGVMIMMYEVTIGVIPNCTCLAFEFMLTTFKKRCYPLQTFFLHL